MDGTEPYNYVGKDKDFLVQKVRKYREKVGITPGIRFILAEKGDRIFHTEKGACFYWKAGDWGMRLPFSSFIKEVLNALDIAPSQLSPVAWCILNSFEDLFIENSELFGPEARASLNLFLEYYDFTFASKSNSWISARRRAPYLFVQINKIDNWSRESGHRKVPI